MRKHLAGVARGMATATATVMALALAGCSPPAAQEASRSAARESPGSAPSGPARGPAVFERAFAGGTLEIDGERLSVEPRTIGHLRSNSGRLVACDPFSCETARPFAARVPQGEFPVQLALVRFGQEERVALARLSLRAGPVVRWEPARVGDGAQGGAAGGFIHGVATGTSAFMDAAAWQEYADRMRREPQAFEASLFAALDRNDAPSRSWLVLALEQGDVALFSSGEGDGGYASYWGYDRQGRLAALLTDFQVLGSTQADAFGEP